MGGGTRRDLTRKDFLRAAGAVGVPLLGAAGCGGLANKLPRVPEEYLPRGGPANNVILVIIDSLRKDHVGAHGNDWIHTPALDALADESLIFARAHPEAMPTLPARRAIHTGMRTWPTRAPRFGWSPIPPGQRTLAEILGAEGYLTQLVTDTYVQFPYRDPDLNFGRGFGGYRMVRGQENDLFRDPSSVPEEELERYMLLGEGNKARQYLANVRGRKREEDWFAPRVFLDAAEALEAAAAGNRPFFLVADCYDPHEPWDPPSTTPASTTRATRARSP